MKVFDISVGAGEPTRAWRDAGDEIITYNMDTDFKGELISAIFDLTPEILIERHGQPDFIWCSPPCVTFSLLAARFHWDPGFVPKSDACHISLKLIAYLRWLIEGLKPTYGFIMENPRGLLRKLPMLQGLELRTVTYCSYGDNRMKPTDLWGTIEDWWPQGMCSPGDKCHDAAPRGTSKGTLARRGGAARAEIPYDLGLEIRNAIVGNEKAIAHSFMINK